MSQKNSPHYFLSANAGEGFLSLYEDAISPYDYDKIFVIYGGPGTGKSTIMHRMGEMAESAGASTEYIHCSSDPHSLDGVICIKNGKRIAVLDGTPPHPRTITSPGFKEELWDIGTFFNVISLAKQGECILEQSKKKKKAYALAYHWLGAARLCHENIQTAYREQLSLPKMREQIHRTLRKLPTHDKSNGVKMLARAYGMFGETVETRAFCQSENIVVLRGPKYAAEVYLSVWEGVLREKGIAHTKYLSPLAPAFLDGIYIPALGCSYIHESLWRASGEVRKINMQRFKIGTGYKDTSLKEACKVEKKLLSMALSALCEASRAHFALEDIYKTVVDFEALGKKSEEWIAHALLSLE